MAARPRLALLLLQLFAVLATAAGIGVRQISGNDTIQLHVKNGPVKYSTVPLGPYEAHAYTIETAGATCTPDQTAYLELWEVAAQSADPLPLQAARDQHKLCIQIRSENQSQVEWQWDLNKGTLSNSAGWSGSELGTSCEDTSYRQVVARKSGDPANWTILLQNFRPWRLTRYALRLSCVDSSIVFNATLGGPVNLPCPAPVLGRGLCAGHGQCQKDTGKCQCEAGWTDYGCGREELAGPPMGEWQVLEVAPSYIPSTSGGFQMQIMSVEVPPDAASLVVEMQWLTPNATPATTPPPPSNSTPVRGGRPRLYATLQSATRAAALSGTSPTNLLNVQTEVFEASDGGGSGPPAALQAVSFQQQGPNAPLVGGRHWVAVVNDLGSDVAWVAVRVRAAGRGTQLCPFDCWGQGECKMGAMQGASECRCRTGFYGMYCQYERNAPPLPLNQYSRRRIALTPKPVPLSPGDTLIFLITKPSRIWLETATVYIALTSSPASTVVVTAADGAAYWDSGNQPGVDENLGAVAPRERPLQLLQTSFRVRYTSSNEVVVAVSLDGDQPALVQLLVDMPRPLLQPKMQVVAIYTAVALLAPLLVIIMLCLRARRIARIEEYDARQLGMPISNRWPRLRHFAAALRPLPPVRIWGGRGWENQVYVPPSRGVPKEIVELFPVIEFEGPESLKPLEVPVGFEALCREAMERAESGGLERLGERGADGEREGAAGGQQGGQQGEQPQRQQGDGEQQPQQKADANGHAGEGEDEAAASKKMARGDDSGTAAGSGRGPAAGSGADPAKEEEGRKQAEQEDGSAQPPVDVSCPVCLVDYDRGDYLRQLLPCHHTYHRRCIDDWLRDHSTCPICRQDLLVHTDRPSDIPGFHPNPNAPRSGAATPANPPSALVRTSRTLHSAAAILLAAVRPSSATAATTAPAAADTTADGPPPPPSGAVAVQLAVATPTAQPPDLTDATPAAGAALRVPSNAALPTPAGPNAPAHPQGPDAV